MDEMEINILNVLQTVVVLFINITRKNMLGWDSLLTKASMSLF